MEFSWLSHMPWYVKSAVSLAAFLSPLSQYFTSDLSLYRHILQRWLCFAYISVEIFPMQVSPLFGGNLVITYSNFNNAMKDVRNQLYSVVLSLCQQKNEIYGITGTAGLTVPKLLHLILKHLISSTHHQLHTIFNISQWEQLLIFATHDHGCDRDIPKRHECTKNPTKQLIEDKSHFLHKVMIHV